MKTLDKKISSFLFMSAMVLGLNMAYASGHEVNDEANTEAYELLGDYLEARESATAYTTYTFYTDQADKVAEFTLEGDEALSPGLSNMIHESDLLMDNNGSKIYIVD